MSALNLGIIGAGGISQKHLQGYGELKDDVKIAAIAETDENKLNRAAEKYCIADKYTNYKELLARKDIDFVCVCLPNYLHAPVTIEALNAGKHVHCEKPMAMNASEAQAMVDAKNKTGKKLMIGLNNRFTPNAMFVKKYIEEGRLGEIYFAKTGWVRRDGLPHAGWFCEKEKSGGGALIDLGVHFIDLVLYYLCYPGFKSITAKTYSKLGRPETYRIYANSAAGDDAGVRYDVEELAAGFVELKNQVDLMFEISWASNIENERNFYEIYGTDGGIKYSWENGKIPELKIFSRIDGQMVDIQPRIKPELYKENEFRHFINCIRANKEPVVSVPEQGVEMMRLIDNIYRSAETGKQIVF